MKLRNGDDLHEVADDINEMLDVLEERGVITINRPPGKARVVAPAGAEIQFNDGLEGSPQDESLTSHTS